MCLSSPAAHSHGLCRGHVCVWPLLVHGGVLFLVFFTCDGGEVWAPAPLRSRWPEQACAGALIFRLCAHGPIVPRSPPHPTDTCAQRSPPYVRLLPHLCCMGWAGGVISARTLSPPRSQEICGLLAEKGPASWLSAVERQCVESSRSIIARCPSDSLAPSPRCIALFQAQVCRVI
jgi:hypothetical protein